MPCVSNQNTEMTNAAMPCSLMYMETKTLLIGIGLATAALLIAYTQGWISPQPSTSTTEQSADLSSPPPSTSIVKRIIDPITIELETGHIVRYIGVRTPDVTEQVQCFGKEALLANESVIGRQVRLEEEPLLARSSDGAWTRYVFLQQDENNSSEQAESSPSPTPDSTSTEDIAPDIAGISDTAKEALERATSDTENAAEESDNADSIVADETENSEETTQDDTPTNDAPEEIFINERILEGGFGFPVVSEGMVYGERMLSAARFASATGKGLWSRCEVSEEGGLHTQQLTSCTIKGKVSANGDKLYRTEECPAYGQTMVIQAEGGQWFCAEDIAEDAGFTKAPDCP